MAAPNNSVAWMVYVQVSCYQPLKLQHFPFDRCAPLGERWALVSWLPAAACMQAPRCQAFKLQSLPCDEQAAAPALGAMWVGRCYPPLKLQHCPLSWAGGPRDQPVCRQRHSC